MGWKELIKGELRDAYERFSGNRFSLEKSMTEQGITIPRSPLQRIKRTTEILLFFGLLYLLPSSIGTTSQAEQETDIPTSSTHRKEKSFEKYAWCMAERPAYSAAITESPISIAKPITEIPAHNSLRSDILEIAGTIRTGKSIHTSLYNTQNKGFVVPGSNYFAIINEKRVGAESKEGLFVIPFTEQEILASNYARIGLINSSGEEESIRTKIEKDFQTAEAPKKVQPDFPQEYKSNDHSKLAQPNQKFTDTEGIATIAAGPEPITPICSKSLDTLVSRAFELQKENTPAWKIAPKLEIATGDVYKLYKKGFEAGEKYTGKSTQNPDTVRANKKMLYTAFMFGEEKNKSFADRAEELYDQGLSMKDIRKQLSKETAQYEASGKRMNVNEDPINEVLRKKGKFFNKYYEKNKQSIAEEFEYHNILLRVDDQLTMSVYMKPDPENANAADSLYMQNSAGLNTAMAR